MSKTYQSPGALKQALEQHLKQSSTGSFDLARRRQLIVFFRFLSRLNTSNNPQMVLKGGLALELRMPGRARTTKDVDLSVSSSRTFEEILSILREAGLQKSKDFMTFEITPDKKNPEIRDVYLGYRFKARCIFQGKIYGRPFGIDVVSGTIIGEPSLIPCPDDLAFADIDANPVTIYPALTHIAEKLHAYTVPRERANSRVKDLPDIALLASLGSYSATELRHCLEQVFLKRGTHVLPLKVPEPPENWKKVYQEIVADNDLEWRNLEDLLSAVSDFLNPILEREPSNLWFPDIWKWS